MVGDYMRPAGGVSMGARYMRFKVGGSMRRCCMWSRNTGDAVLRVERWRSRTGERLDALKAGGEM